MAKHTTIEAKGTPVEIGIDEVGRHDGAESLSRLLADTFTLYLHTHNFHWNVTGPMFPQLHALFGEQYTELWKAVDEIAERIRALGSQAPGTYRELMQTSLEEPEGNLSAEEMVRVLLEGHETVARGGRTMLPGLERSGDQATFDLVVQRLAAHEKAAWMLRSILA